MEPAQLEQYLPVLILAGIACFIIAGMMIASVLLGKKGQRPPIKDTAYECGMFPIGPGTARFSVKFYLVAMLFILFDIEVVFLYPWAVIYREQLTTQPNLVFGAMVSFLGVLLVGYGYCLKKGALRWRD